MPTAPPTPETTTPEAAKAALEAALAADVPALLWGPPGVGKTATLRAMARKAGAHLEVLVASRRTPEEIAGAVGLDGREIPPAWARRVRAALDRAVPAWVLLDEFSNAPRSVRAALLSVVQDREVMGLDLRGVRWIAAANPPDTACDGGDLDAPTANRWAHIEWPLPPAGEWAAGLVGGWGTPPPAQQARARALVAGWVRRSPAALYALPRDEAARGRAWPSPRTWEAAALLLAALPGCERHPHALAVVAGAVGAPAAAEAAAWWVAAALPDPEDVLAGRERLPQRGDACAATLDAVVAAAGAPHADRAARLLAATRVIDVAPRAAGLLAAGALERAARAAGVALPDEWLVGWGEALAAVRSGR